MPKSATAFYDDFSQTYDVFVSWRGRLRNEGPFIRGLLRKNKAKRVLDIGCGTGVHAIAFARWGYESVGADISTGMIRRAQENAVQAGVPAQFVVAGFGNLRQTVEGEFDAVVCLGNSLPHLLAEDELAGALKDIYAVLKPGGLFINQNLNFDLICEERNRFLPLSTWRTKGRSGIFFRFLDFNDSTITFNVVTLVKEGKSWSQQISSTRWRPIFKADLERLLKAAAFREPTFYADYQGHPWSVNAGRDLILVVPK